MCSLPYRQLALAAWLLALPATAGTELLMIERPGCEWCEAWDEEIGPIYPKTDEGRQAPLRRVDLRDIPGEITLDRPARYTPTFVLLEDDNEIGRIEGYPGEDFFWGLLGRLLKAPPTTTGTPVEGGS